MACPRLLCRDTDLATGVVKRLLEDSAPPQRGERAARDPSSMLAEGLSRSIAKGRRGKKHQRFRECWFDLNQNFALWRSYAESVCFQQAVKDHSMDGKYQICVCVIADSARLSSSHPELTSSLVIAGQGL